jgi:hypothetical protein
LAAALIPLFLGLLIHWGWLVALGGLAVLAILTSWFMPHGDTASEEKVRLYE